jgi:hypothetical protein
MNRGGQSAPSVFPSYLQAWQMAVERTSRAGRQARSAIPATAPRRRLRRAVALVLALALAVLSGSAGGQIASASVYWYGAAPDCWQPSAPAAAVCDAAGGGGTLANAVTGDLNATRSGDFCNLYNAPGACTDGGATWSLSFDASAQPCPRSRPFACGAQHYVSLAEQADLPWGAVWMREPTLVIAAEFELASAVSPDSTWGYLCPLLKAPAQPYYLEYCFDAWHAPGATPPAAFAPGQLGLVASCAPVTVAGVRGAVDTLVTPFALGQATPYATTLPGSADTQTGPAFARTRFLAAITLPQLRRAIALDNGPKRVVDPASPGPGYGCERGLSTVAADYRLVGVEQGFESAPGARVAGTVAGLRLSTSYSATGAEGLVPALGE